MYRIHINSEKFRLISCQMNITVQLSVIIWLGMCYLEIDPTHVF